MRRVKTRPGREELRGSRGREEGAIADSSSKLATRKSDGDGGERNENPEEVNKGFHALQTWKKGSREQNRDQGKFIMLKGQEGPSS